MTIVWRGPDSWRDVLAPLSELRSLDGNARLHGERNLAALASSLDRFGQFRLAVVADSLGAGSVIIGNGMLAAARELGWTHLAVHRSALSAGDARAAAIADNRIAELATWDDEALRIALAEIAADESAALAATGYDAEEIEALLRSFDSVEPLADGGDRGRLPTGDRRPFREFHIVLHDEQADIVDRALVAARRTVSPHPKNDNLNAAALVALALAWLERSS